MRLSSLQKFILLECLHSKTGRINRSRLNKFYDTVSAHGGPAPGGKARPKDEMITKILTKSMERLMNKSLLVGFGERTAHKWFIKEIRITRVGKKVARDLLGKQVSLPFKKKRTKK